MSIFLCTTCDNLRDADDGCETDATGFGLTCIQCADELLAADEEAEDRRRANPLEPDYRRMGALPGVGK